MICNFDFTQKHTKPSYLSKVCQWCLVYMSPLAKLHAKLFLSYHTATPLLKNYEQVYIMHASFAQVIM